MAISSKYERVQKGCNRTPSQTSPANFKVWPIFNDKERAELKEIMIEALKEYHNTSSPYRLDEFQE